MKYSGAISIIDDQGNSVFERELSPDEIIAEIISKLPATHFEYAGELAGFPVLVSEKPPTTAEIVKAATTIDHSLSRAPSNKKGCPECGSGTRHKNTCSQSTQSKAASGEKSVTVPREPVRDLRSNSAEANKVIPPIKFIEVKHLQSRGKTAVEIAGLKNLDTVEVVQAMKSNTHAEYLRWNS